MKIIYTTNAVNTRLAVFIFVFYSFTFLAFAQKQNHKNEKSLSKNEIASRHIKPRIIAMPDFGADPDDKQSMVRLLLSANEFDIEGLINVTSCWRTKQTSYEAFNVFISAYEKVFSNLQQHAVGFPQPDYLRSICRLGQQNYGMADVGEGKDSPGSDLIIKAADKPDDRPLWITLWGGANTLAQAIWKVRNTRNDEDFNAFISKLRVYDVLGQDDAGAWIVKNYPNLFYLRARNQVYGWQMGKEKDNVWIANNVKNKGSMGSVYPDVEYSMEGDTPAFMYVFPNGLNNPEFWTHGSWGGRFDLEKTANVRGMAESKILENEYKFDDYYMYSDAPEGGEAIRRWREAVQNDFLARLQWSITDSYAKANHKPIAILNGDKTKMVLNKTIAAGRRLKLSAKRSFDPDADVLQYNWFVYDAPSTYKGKLDIKNHTANQIEIIFPKEAKGKEIHIVLELKDNGSPQLTSYRRVIITVK